MSKQVRFRRGTTAQHATFTGAAGEVTVDTDKVVPVVHNGTTAGGIPLLREDLHTLFLVKLTSNAFVSLLMVVAVVETLVAVVLVVLEFVLLKLVN
jgi:hypothetical protein